MSRIIVRPQQSVEITVNNGSRSIPCETIKDLPLILSNLIADSIRRDYTSVRVQPDTALIQVSHMDPVEHDLTSDGYLRVRSVSPPPADWKFKHVLEHASADEHGHVRIVISEDLPVTLIDF